MTTPMKINLKLCGSCNPHIQTGQVYREIKKEALHAGLDLEFYPWDEPGSDLLLVISGCPVDCAERPANKIEELIVAGETLNHQPCPSGHLAKEALKRIVNNLY